MPDLHVERRARLAGGKTYCACGRPWPCPMAAMPDPYVFGPEVSAEGRAAAAGFLEAEARALGRAYQAHGDQLGALEAEAAADHYQAESRKLGAWLRMLFGPWSDTWSDPPGPLGVAP